MEDGQDPLAAVKSSTALGEETSVLVLENFHRFLGSPEIIQALVSQLHAGKQNRSIIVMLAPVLELPPELEKMFVAIEHSLPDREQLQEIAAGIGVELEQVLDAASGLTRAAPDQGRPVIELTWSLQMPKPTRISTISQWFDERLESIGLPRAFAVCSLAQHHKRGRSSYFLGSASTS